MGNSDYYAALVDSSNGPVDFICVHQYLWAYQNKVSDYEGWKHYSGTYMSNVKRAVSAVSNHPDMEILITETNANGGKIMNPRGNTLYASLCWFEMLMQEISTPQVSYIYF